MNGIEALVAVVVAVAAAAVIITYIWVDNRPEQQPAEPPRANLITAAGKHCEHNWDVLSSNTISSPTMSKFVCIVSCYKCGSLNKTVEVVSECQHKWTEPEAVMLDSAYEQIRKTAQASRRGGGWASIEIPNATEKTRWIFHKTLVRERLCRSCGLIHSTVASNFANETEPEPAKG